MVRFSLGVVTPLLGERLEGFRSAFCVPVPFSWRYKTVARYKRKYGNKAKAGGAGFNGSRLYLGLGTAVVFLLGHVLPALRLGSRYVVGNGH